MGLDMYLEGRTYRWHSRDHEEELKRDGFRVKGEILEIGYWRKHPDLHGYLVNEFAGGVDDCKEIWLNEEMLQKIIDAIKANKLPHTEGFFFGESDGSEREESIKIFEMARTWLLTKDPAVGKDVYYQASW